MINLSSGVLFYLANQNKRLMPLIINALLDRWQQGHTTSHVVLLRGGNIRLMGLDETCNLNEGVFYEILHFGQLLVITFRVNPRRNAVLVEL